MIKKKVKTISFEKLAASVWSCFPIISPSSKAYVKPFRQYKDLSDKIELITTQDNNTVKYVYWTTIPAMFLCALSDIFGHKDACLDFLAMGVTKHEGHAEFARYVDHYNELVKQVKHKHDWEMTEGERAFLRKIKIVRTKLKNIKDGETIFNYD